MKDDILDDIYNLIEKEIKIKKKRIGNNEITRQEFECSCNYFLNYAILMNADLTKICKENCVDKTILTNTKGNSIQITDSVIEIAALCEILKRKAKY